MLALDPDILILDEPFSSLDFEGVRSVLRILLDLHAAGHGLLVITHDLDKLTAHAQRVVLMEAGRIAADGPAEDLLSQVGRYGLRPPPGAIEEMSWL
jgi:energy-coupling factor transporter ATP-binding protein EcfA2